MTPEGVVYEHPLLYNLQKRLLKDTPKGLVEAHL